MADDSTQSPAPSKDLNPTRGAATTFSSSQYNIDQFQYPNDLYSNNNVYGGNYVIFYVNVAEDSRILTVNGEPTVDPSLVPPRLRGDLVAQNFNAAQTEAGAAAPGAIAGAVAGGSSGAGKGIQGVAKGALKGTAIGAAPGFLGAATVANATKDANGNVRMGRQQKRLQKAIALHVPNNLSISYNAQWDAEDTAMFQMGAVAGEEITKAFSQDGAKNNQASGVGAILTSLALSKGPAGAALSAASGLAANPKKENLFKSVDFRTFTFNYKFFPRDAGEANNVMNIIKEFKVHMHPEYKDSNNFVFIYPSEFDIYYYNNGSENLNLHRHTSCVLTHMNVNYTPNGMLNTFDNGMPTQIDVEMTFKELSILTKKEILDGF
jgi:hypothetical protein